MPDWPARQHVKTINIKKHRTKYTRNKYFYDASLREKYFNIQKHIIEVSIIHNKCYFHFSLRDFKVGLKYFHRNKEINFYASNN